MDRYEKYIQKIKTADVNPDFDNLYSNIMTRAHKPNFRFDLALCGALAILLMSFGAYYKYNTQSINAADNVAEYVFQQDYPNGNTLAGYVFDN